LKAIEFELSMELWLGCSILGQRGEAYYHVKKISRVIIPLTVKYDSLKLILAKDKSFCN
jgi:hypothetical protein